MATRRARGPVAAEPADPDIERWRVYDLSSKGYGLLVDRAAASWCLLNGLIALRNHETGGWIVGLVVRKLAEPRARRDPHRRRGARVSPACPSIWFPPRADRATRRSTFRGSTPTASSIRWSSASADFRTDQTHTIEAGGAESTACALNRIIRKGADWIKARFEIESKA